MKKAHDERLRRIALTTRRTTDPAFGEIRDALSRDWCNYISSTWHDVLPLPILNICDRVRDWARTMEIDAVILTNGNDWGEERERDETETRLVDWCREKEIPVLGVCRGLQALNAILGGEIETNICQSGGKSHAGTFHQVAIVDRTIVEATGVNTIQVNSYHDQGVKVDGLAAGLVPFALAEGGVVEGFYHQTEPILAIQWHPERAGAPTQFDRILVDRFWTEGSFWSQQSRLNE